MQPNAVFSSPMGAEQWQLTGQPKSSEHALLLLTLFLESTIQTGWLLQGTAGKPRGKYFKNPSHIIT